MVDEEIDILVALNSEGSNKNFEIPSKVSETVIEVDETTGKVEEVIPASNKDECLRKIGNILADYSFLESNIPIGHEYWGLIGQLRTMK